MQKSKKTIDNTIKNLVYYKSKLKWFRGVGVNTSACHAEDREFKSRRNRHFFYFGSVAQSVEHRTENPGVGSSILPGATIL